MRISCEQLIEQFETLRLPPSELTHVNHLHIVWYYLRDLELDQAIEKVTTGTKEYAESLGIFDKYHRTVTEATVRIMKKRISEIDAGDFDNFLNQNDDLVSGLKNLLGKYYSEDVINSSVARERFLPPDRCAFE